MSENPEVQVTRYKFVPTSGVKAPYNECLEGLMGVLNGIDRKRVCLRYSSGDYVMNGCKYVVDKKELMRLFTFSHKEDADLSTHTQTHCVCGVAIYNICYYTYNTTGQSVEIGICCNSRWNEEKLQDYEYKHKLGKFRPPILGENRKHYVCICRFCRGNRTIMGNHKNCTGKKNLQTIFEAWRMNTCESVGNELIDIGKYKGRKVRNIWKNDRQWFLWMINKYSTLPNFKCTLGWIYMLEWMKWKCG